MTFLVTSLQQKTEIRNKTKNRRHSTLRSSSSDVIPIKLNLKVKMTLDADNLLSLERHKAKGLKG